MSVVTFDVGGSAIAVECQRAGKAAPRRAGDKPVAFLGAEDSSIRGEFMVVPLVLAPKTPVEAAAIRALFALGAQIPCAGDVFNNANATIVCSGKISDELDQTAAWWTLNLTLYEVGSSAGYTPLTVLMYLTNVSAGGGKFVASTDSADDPFAAGLGGVDLMAPPEVIPTCGGTPDPAIHCTVGYTSVPALIFESIPAPADGLLVGVPTLRFLSTGGTGDRWNTQAYRGQIYVDRGGTDVAQWTTGYSDTNGGFAGGTSTAVASAVVFNVLAGDKIRVEIEARAGLNQGYASDGVYQHLTHGNGGAGNHYGTLTYRGTALFE